MSNIQIYPTKVEGDLNPMTVRPLHDRVLIKRIEEQETVKGGIIIPDTAKEKSQEGEVVAVGTGKTLENGSVAPLEVKEGDRILFGKYSGTQSSRGAGLLGTLASRPENFPDSVWEAARQ